MGHDHKPSRTRFRRVLHWLRSEPLLLVLALLTLALGVLDPQPWARWRNWLDLPMLASLLALLIVAQGIRDSGYVQRLAGHLVGHIRGQRRLALGVMGLSALLAMGLTNDVSLFLTVPLTLAVCDVTELPRVRLVTLVALAVNAGSALSPIGNPQNLLLWRQSGVNMAQFVFAMMPTAAIMAGCLVIAVCVWIPRRPLQAVAVPAQEPRAHPGLGGVSLALLAALIVFLQLGLEWPALAGVVVVYAVFWRGVLRRADWALIVMIALMLLGFGHLAQWAPVHAAMQRTHWRDPRTTLVGGVLLSQAISNVPATIALLQQHAQPLVLAIAVNVGGAGLVFGSLANFIALRLEGGRRIWRTFHWISVPYLLLVAGLVWLGLRMAAAA